MEELMNEEELKKLHSIEVEILDDFVKICEENNLTYFLVGGTLLGAIRHNGFIPWDDDLDVGMPREDYEKFINEYANKLGDKYTLDNKNTNPMYYLNFTKIRKNGTVFEQDFQTNYNGHKGIWLDIFAFDNSKGPKSIITFTQVKLNRMIFNVLHYKNNFFVGGKYIKIKKIIAKIFSCVKHKTFLEFQDKILKWNMNHNEYKYFASLSTTYNYKNELIEKNKYFPIKKGEFEGKMYNIPNDSDYILRRVYGDYMKMPPKGKRITHKPVKLYLGKENNII